MSSQLQESTQIGGITLIKPSPHYVPIQKRLNDLWDMANVQNLVANSPDMRRPQQQKSYFKSPQLQELFSPSYKNSFSKEVIVQDEPLQPKKEYVSLSPELKAIHSRQKIQLKALSTPVQKSSVINNELSSVPLSQAEDSSKELDEEIPVQTVTVSQSRVKNEQKSAKLSSASARSSEHLQKSVVSEQSKCSTALDKSAHSLEQKSEQQQTAVDQSTISVSIPPKLVRQPRSVHVSLADDGIQTDVVEPQLAQAGVQTSTYSNEVQSQGVGDAIQTSQDDQTKTQQISDPISTRSSQAVEYNITNKQRKAKHIKWSNDFGLGYLNKYCIKKDDSRYTEFDSTYISDQQLTNSSLSINVNDESSQFIDNSKLCVSREVKRTLKDAPPFTVHQSSCGLNTDVVYKLVE